MDDTVALSLSMALNHRAVSQSPYHDQTLLQYRYDAMNRHTSIVAIAKITGLQNNTSNQQKKRPR